MSNIYCTIMGLCMGAALALFAMEMFLHPELTKQIQKLKRENEELKVAL